MKSLARYKAGMTLVEVMASLLLLGTLLVSLLMAKIGYTRQARGAEARVAAAAVAEQLLSEWWKDTAEFPREDSGLAGPSKEWAWRTSIVRDEQFEPITVEIVRLEVFGQAKESAVVVDVVMPLTPEKAREKARQQAG